MITRPTRGIPLTQLAAWRARMFLTQRALAARSGVGERTISLLEKGHTTARFSTVEKLATALGIPREQLAHGPPPVP